MSEDFAGWLESIGLGKYVSVFAENDVDFRVLPALSEQDLKDLGLTLGHRRILQGSIAELSRDEITPAASLPSPDAAMPGSDAGLAAWERHPGERKPVTMLFADITGSTALTEKLDAEETHELLYGVTQRMCEAVERCRGRVCRVMGDGLMAMFGAPVASEHHALEACEAALEMQRGVGEYARDIEVRHGAAIRIRVGLHSGEVVVLQVGEGDSMEYDASGPTVPIAARMEQAAEPGTVYLTAATRALAGNRIEAQQLQPVLVKGISEPLPVFALRRVRSVEDGIIQGTRTPFVGRRSEISQFRSILDSCIEDGHGQTVYVRGEPGIGKTRLIEEFIGIAATKDVTCHRSQVLDFGVGRGKDAIRALVRSLLELEPGASADIRQRAVDTAIRDGSIESNQRVYLNDLMDLPQPTELRTLYDAMDDATRNRGKQAVVSHLLDFATKDHAILIIVEDLQWASPLTLAHVANLNRAVSGCAALLVITSRTESDPLDRAWRSSAKDSPLITIDLGPLREHESMAVISHYFEVGGSLAEECAQRAAGNPLFLEQLLQSAARGSMEALPDSIQSLVLARIDRLPSGDKRALQAASVIGQRFSLECLRTLLADPDFDCGVLIADGLVRADEDDLFFAHALIRESVYASLLKPQRCRFHSEAAAFFANNDPVLHAEHLARAEDPGAAQAYLDAARLQSSLYRTEAALDLVERALKLGPADWVRYELACLKGELLLLQGQTDASMAVWRDAVSHAQDDEQRCIALMGIASVLRLSSDYTEALKIVDAAEDSVDTHLSPLVRSRLYNLRGNLYFPIGEIEKCLENHELALRFAEESGSDEARANALSGLADVAYLQGRMLSAGRFFGECAALAREHGLGRIEVSNALLQGFSQAYGLDLAPARSMMAKYLDMARLVGNRRAEMIALRGEMLIIRLTGQWTKMGEVVARLREVNEMVGMKGWIGSCESSDALYKFAVGEYEEALEAAARAVALDKENAVRFNLCRSIATRALLLDDEDQTRAVLEEGERYLGEGAVSHNHLWFYRDAMWASYRWGDWDRAERYAAALETYTRAEPLPWSDFYCTQARTLSALAKDAQDPSAYGNLSSLHDQANRAGFLMDARALHSVIRNLDRGDPPAFPDLKSLIR